LSNKGGRAEGGLDPKISIVKKSTWAGRLASGAQVAGALSVIPFLAPFATPVGAGLAAAASLAKYMGFTKIENALNPMSMKIRSIASVAIVDGEEHNDPTGLFASNALVISPGLSVSDSGEDVCSFASLWKRWTVMSSFTWATSQTVDTILLRVPVTPALCIAHLGIYSPTVPGYVGAAFAYWRGSLHYRLLIPASAFHRGDLQVVWTNDVNSTFANDPTGSTRNLIVALSGPACIDFTVGYAAQGPMLRFGGWFDVSNPQFASLSTNTYSNGQLAFIVKNQLQSPIASTVTCHLMVRGGEDLTFGCPSEYMITTTGLKDSSNLFVLQSFQDESCLNAAVTLVPVTQMPSIRDTYMGEEILSVRPFFEKFSWVGTLASETGTDQVGTIVRPHYISPISNTFPDPANIYAGTGSSGTMSTHNWASYMAAMFLGIKASKRIKVIPLYTGIVALTNPLAVAFRGTLAYAAYTGSTIASYGAPLTGNGTATANHFYGAAHHAAQSVPISGASEFSFPAYTRYAYHTTRSVQNAPLTITTLGESDVISFGNYGPTGTAVGTMYTIYEAYGPDVCITRFRRTPQVLKT